MVDPKPSTETTVPFYNVLHSTGLFSAETRSMLANRITELHCELTGAPRQFVHVYFSPHDPSNIFSGGEPSEMVLLRAFTREGRPQELKEEMLKALTGIFVQRANVQPHNFMVTMLETPGTNAMEAGVLLPHPADDADWYEKHGHLRAKGAK